jgi:site-specific DNA-methyltransferase (adenine-specific)/modification methylase
MAEKVIIGDCEIWHGDCREVLPMLPQVDLILTDPPYGIGYAAQPTKWSRDNMAREAEEWDNELPDVLPIVAKGNFAMVWGGNHFPLPPTRGWLAWVKPPGLPSYGTTELCWTNLSMPCRHLACERVNGGKEQHPTQKPVRLMEWCLSFAPKARTVCDPFMGSGTTGVAYARMGLQFVGIERERKYFDIACRRIEQAYAQRRLFDDEKLATGNTPVQTEIIT